MLTDTQCAYAVSLAVEYDISCMLLLLMTAVVYCEPVYVNICIPVAASRSMHAVVVV
jgi:hypothetical protein